MATLKRLHIAFVALVLTQITTTESFGQQPTLLRMIDELELVRSAEEELRGLSPTPNPEPKTKHNAFAPKPVALSSQDPQKFGLLDQAYLDAYTILNYDNPCSRFYGGRLSITALNEFVRQLKLTHIDRNVAVRMSGPITTFQSHMTGFKFRLFEKVELNLSGSFFKSRAPTERYAGIVSEFPPNTRETRVVVVLHELGHLVKNQDDKWLLPDDGGDASLSVENSRKVLTACRDEIKAISQLSHALEFEMSKGDPPK